MSSEIFSALEIDAIGEILNISLGASATAASNMLSRRVDITTPNVAVVTYDAFEFAEIEPAIGVEITYISGLSGRNVMLLKRHDAKVICEILMGMEIPDDEFELNEMNKSAVSEVMNQMMGGSSTALSEFLGEVVNISTPNCFEIPDLDAFKAEYFGEEKEKVVAYFKLKVEDAIESQFMNLMPVPLAKKLLKAFNLGGEEEEYVPEVSTIPEPASSQSSGGTLSQEEIEKLINGGVASEPQSEPEVEMPDMPGRTMSQEEIEKLLGSMSAETESAAAPESQPSAEAPQGTQTGAAPGAQQTGQPGAVPPGTVPPNMGMYGMPPMYPPGTNPPEGAGMPAMGMYPYMYPYGMYPYGMYPPPQEEKKPKEPRDPRIFDVKPITTPQFEESPEELGKEQAENLSLIMEVPLEVSVEIGRTKKCVKDILELTSGSLVVLDKLAGEQVDIYANGQCIAKGDVVVVDDSFGVRITEIVKNSQIKLVNGIGNE